jgi:serine/threonine-protein kinase HipA
MMIDDRDNSASFDLVLEVGDYFGLRTDDMKLIAGEVASAISRWREEAGLLGISNSEITRMTSAFEHDDLRKARDYSSSTR